MNIANELEELDKLKSWLDSFRPLPRQVVEEMKSYYDVSFTYNSNAIEGNTLTKSETQLVLEKGITIGGKALVEHLEVIGHGDAINYIEELADSETRIGEREIKDINAIILRAIMPDEAGAYRRIDVKAAGSDYVYPQHLLLGNLMQEFVSWLSSEKGESLHPVVFATEAHYRFVSIHPFRDGNGRTARLLMNLFLIRKGYPIAVITNQRRNDYIDSLADAQERDDRPTALLKIVAEACRESMIDYLRMLSTFKESDAERLPFYNEMMDILAERNQTV